MAKRSGFPAFVAALLVAALAQGAPARADGFCIAQWAPVCGLKNGAEQTYANTGCAKVDDAEIVRQGRCEDSPPPAPASTPAAEPTPTPAPALCAEDYAPVCAAKDGASKTYSNACLARADGASVSANGECPKP